MLEKKCWNIYMAEVFLTITGVLLFVFAIKTIFESLNRPFPPIGIYLWFYVFMVFCAWLCYEAPLDATPLNMPTPNILALTNVPLTNAPALMNAPDTPMPNAPILNAPDTPLPNAPALMNAPDVPLTNAPALMNAPDVPLTNAPDVPLTNETLPNTSTALTVVPPKN